MHQRAMASHKSEINAKNKKESNERNTKCIIFFYLFLSQNIAQNDPLKNIPSTAAKATNRSANLLSDPIHLQVRVRV